MEFLIGLVIALSIIFGYFLTGLVWARLHSKEIHAKGKDEQRGFTVEPYKSDSYKRGVNDAMWYYICLWPFDILRAAIAKMAGATDGTLKGFVLAPIEDKRKQLAQAKTAVEFWEDNLTKDMTPAFREAVLEILEFKRAEVKGLEKYQ